MTMNAQPRELQVNRIHDEHCITDNPDRYDDPVIGRLMTYAASFLAVEGRLGIDVGLEDEMTKGSTDDHGEN